MTDRTPTYYIKTFGCQMNKFDAGVFERLFLEQGLAPAAEPGDADVAHVLTCCVRQKAEDKFFSLLGELRQIKEERPGMVIGVSGCITELRDVAAAHKYVDYVVGSGAPEKHFEEIMKALGSRFDLSALPPRAPAAGTASAYVTVIRGCSNYCTYCVVPRVRGHEASCGIDEIVTGAKKLLDAGTREIILLGQNALAYGADLTPPLSLLDALRAVHELPGLRRLRFVTSHPKWLAEDFLRGLRELPLVCEHFHIPCQAGDDGILKRMNRKYTAAEYENKVAMIRNYFPAAGITADVIAGFPGETDAQFENTLELLRRVRANQTYMFMYSPRPGTAAGRMEDDVPFETKSARLQKLIKLQREISLEHNQKVIGTEMEIMVDHSALTPGQYKGRTRCNRIADFTAQQALNPGDIVRVNIESVSPYAIKGDLVIW